MIDENRAAAAGPGAARRHRWALCVLLAALPGCGTDDPTIYREAGPAWGIDFTSGVSPHGHYPIPEIVGSGVAVFDAHGDGLPDVYLIDAGSGRDQGQPNRFYRGLPGGGFQEATEESGLGDPGYGTGVAVGDVDNDGDLDVYVTNWGRDMLYVNDGEGVFTARPDAGFTDERWATAAAFVDFDLDGWLDLYVARHANPDVFASGEPARDLVDYNGPGVYEHEDDSLYRNRGDGTFEDVTEKAGIQGHPAASFGIIVEDVDDDGWPDVFVANDGVRNHLWMNMRDGTFREEGVQRGVAFNGFGSSEASMGAAMGDVDGDGKRDLFLTHLGGETNTLYRGGRGGWTDATGRSGAGVPSVSRTGWGAELFDIECDGDLDLVVVNGSTWRLATPFPGPSPKPWADYAEPNDLFLNDGRGTFVVATQLAPGFREESENSRGLAAADLDNDGDLDLIVTNIGGKARIYENVRGPQGHWIGLRLMDPDLRREAYGAQVTVVAGQRRFVDVVGPSTSFLASVDAPLHVGLGEATTVDVVEVVWPGGIRETFDLTGVDRVHVLTRGEGSR